MEDEPHHSQPPSSSCDSVPQTGQIGASGLPAGVIPANGGPVIDSAASPTKSPASEASSHSPVSGIVNPSKSVMSPAKSKASSTDSPSPIGSRADSIKSARSSARSKDSNKNSHSPAGSPAPSLGNKMSPTKSETSNTKSHSHVSSSVHSTKSAASKAKSRDYSAHSQPPPNSHQSTEGFDKDYETFGKDEDSYDVFKPNVIKLCHDIGYGEPDVVERMEGGSYNKVIGLKFNSPKERKCILRMPRFIFDERQPHEISDQVSVLLYLNQFDFMKVPQVLAYDMTTENAIGSQYVLQSWLSGSCMQDKFYKLSRSEKLEITGLIAEIAIQMSKVMLQTPGRLIGTRTLPQVSHSPPPGPLESIETAGYREYPVQNPPPLARQPLAQSLIDLFEFRKKEEHEMVILMYERLQEITREMETAGLMRIRDINNVLWHWDFTARNILIEQKDIAEVATQIQPQEVKIQQDDAIGLDNTRATDQAKGTLGNGCHHSLRVSVEDGDGNGHKHSVQVSIEDITSITCKHTVSVVIDDNKGRQYRHGLEIMEKGTAEQSQSQQNTDMAGQKNTVEDKIEKGVALNSKKWAISGVLDWDEVLSVTLVLARAPNAWLWLDEDERKDDWTGNQDDLPHRDLTEDEMLIKAHYDQIMARDDPNYMEDAYGRGRWLRILAAFGRGGFGDSRDFVRYEKFITNWAEHYRSMGFESKLKDDESVGDVGQRLVAETLRSL